MSSLHFLVVCLLCFVQVDHAEAHGYLKSPRSRNYVAYQDGVWYGGGVTETPKESCPHCLNLGGTLAQCGLIGRRNYDLPLNVFGDPLPPSTQATYNRGDEIDVEIILTAHHMGHFEFAACAITAYEIPAAECFQPLTFVADLLYGAPKDESYPERAMIPPISHAYTDASGLFGTKYAYRMKLPDNVYGDIVLLQWHYYTANSCNYPGYEVYPFPEEWSYNFNGVALCDDVPPNGQGVPEQFWNCAEIQILDIQVPPTTAEPVSSPTPIPKSTLTPSPDSQTSNPLPPANSPSYPPPDVQITTGTGPDEASRGKKMREEMWSRVRLAAATSRNGVACCLIDIDHTSACRLLRDAK